MIASKVRAKRLHRRRLGAGYLPTVKHFSAGNFVRAGNQPSSLSQGVSLHSALLLWLEEPAQTASSFQYEIQIMKPFADLKHRRQHLPIYLYFLRRSLKWKIGDAAQWYNMHGALELFSGFVVCLFVFNVTLFSLFENFIHLYNVSWSNLPFISNPELRSVSPTTVPSQFLIFSSCCQYVHGFRVITGAWLSIQESHSPKKADSSPLPRQLPTAPQLRVGVTIPPTACWDLVLNDLVQIVGMLAKHCEFLFDCQLCPENSFTTAIHLFWLSQSFCTFLLNKSLDLRRRHVT